MEGEQARRTDLVCLKIEGHPANPTDGLHDAVVHVVPVFPLIIEEILHDGLVRNNESADPQLLQIAAEPVKLVMICVD